MIYHYGSNSIESNANKAIELYEKGANLDYIGSMQNLGIVYSDGIIVKKENKRLFFKTSLFFAAKTLCQFP